jgi:3-methyladenine DNA glycosylase AlkD
MKTTMRPPAAADVIRDLRKWGNKQRARLLARYFKAEPGGYGEGDIFVGVPVPAIRHVAGKYKDLSLSTVEDLLQSPIHEVRLLALLVLTRQFSTADKSGRTRVYRCYMRKLSGVNNWDLVDLSAPLIVGPIADVGEKTVLDRLAGSRRVWDRRIAVLSTAYFIRNDKFTPTLRLARKLLRDEHDLIHKAVGWMLREVGKRDIVTLTNFLDTHHHAMPRMMLRYAIERLPPAHRGRYLRRSL